MRGACWHAALLDAKGRVMTADQNWPMRPHEVGASARALRHRSRLRQSDVAARARVSQSMVSRVERGAWDEIQWASITRVCEAAGLRVVVEGRWRGGELARLLDQDHAALTAAARRRLDSAGWQTDVEVTFSRFGERGSIDILAFHSLARVLLVVEVKSVIADIQGLLQPIDAKARLAPGIGRDRGWTARAVVPCLVVADSTTTRRRVAANGPLFSRFAVRGRSALRWLRAPVGTPTGLLLLTDPPSIRGGNVRRAGRQRVRQRAANLSVDPGPPDATVSP